MNNALTLTDQTTKAITTYRPKLLPADVVVLALDRDLIVEKGNVIVIPLHNPSGFTTLPKLLFDAMFIRTDAERPAPPIPTPPGRVTRQAVVRALKQVPPAPVITKKGKVPYLAPQTARILVAIDFVTTMQHSDEVFSALFRNVLDKADRRQYATRIPRLVQDGYVTRTMISQKRPGYIVKITEKGREIAKRLGDLPWTTQQMPLPKWLKPR